MFFSTVSEPPMITFIGKIEKHLGIFCLGCLTLQHAVSGLLMFSWQIWDANLTDNSKIGDEFKQNRLSEVCIVQFIARIHPLSLELSVKFVSQIWVIVYKSGPEKWSRKVNQFFSGFLQQKLSGNNLMIFVWSILIHLTFSWSRFKHL